MQEPRCLVVEKLLGWTWRQRTTVAGDAGCKVAGRTHMQTPVIIRHYSNTINRAAAASDADAAAAASGRNL